MVGNDDAAVACVLAMTVIGSRGRVQLEGTVGEFFVAEHDGLTVSLYPNRSGRPILVTVDAPGRVLEVELDRLDDEAPNIVQHSPGDWQQRLFAAAKPKLRWSERTRWAAPWRRPRGWPLLHLD
jgi:hypothetical protein